MSSDPLPRKIAGYVRDRRAYLEPAGVALVTFLIYNVTLPVNLGESHDSIAYLTSIETNQIQNLFIPSHLLYAVVGKAFWRVWQLFGYTGGALIPLQELNVLFACMSIAVLYILLRNALNSRWRSLLVCSAVAFSFGFWFYAGTVEVYIIPLFPLLLSFSLLFLSLQRPALKIFASAGILNALAVLFHLMNVLFSAAALATILFNRRLHGTKEKALATATYAVCLSVPVVLAYIVPLASVVKPDSFLDALLWVTGPVRAGSSARIEALSPMKAALGFTHAFIGGHFLFAIEPLGSLISSVLRGKSLVSQQFLVHNLGTPQGYGLLFGSLPLAAVFVAAVVSYIRSWREIWTEHRGLLTLEVAWFVPYAMFVFWWEPFNVDFWVSTIIPAWLLLSLPFFTPAHGAKALPGAGRYAHALLPLAVVSLLVVNLLGSMLPLHSPDLDYYRQRASWYVANTKTGDLIVCSRNWIWGQYLTHYVRADVLGVAEILAKDKDAGGIVDQRIRVTLESGGSVYVTSDAVRPEATTLVAYRLDAAAFASLWTKYRHSWVRIDIAAGDEVYVLSGAE